MKDDEEHASVEAGAEASMATWVAIGLRTRTKDLHIVWHEVGPRRSVEKFYPLIVEGFNSLHKE
jgi:hypothetical protein